jgi:hypothetical protein
MSNSKNNPFIRVKTVADVFVAYSRFIGRTSDVPGAFERLHARARDVIVGDPICLYDVTANDKPGEEHIEVCYPVDEHAADGLQTRRLPGVTVMSMEWTGSAGTPWGRADWWKGARSFVSDQYLTIDEDPIREIRHLEGDTETIEVQYTLQFPRWMAGLENGLVRLAGEQACRQVMEGSDRILVDSPIKERLTWVQQALVRLDEVVKDPDTRRCIMNGCAHRYPQVRIEKLRAVFQESRDIDKLLEVMRADTSAGGTSWYAHPERKGSIIHNYNDPADPQGVAQAKNDLDKRIATCFCPIVHAALRKGVTLSTSFCNCSAGYTRQLWEGIFQQPVHVEIVESILHGDPRCSFEIRIPESVL